MLTTADHGAQRIRRHDLDLPVVPAGPVRLACAGRSDQHHQGRIEERRHGASVTSRGSRDGTAVGRGSVGGRRAGGGRRVERAGRGGARGPGRPHGRRCSSRPISLGGASVSAQVFAGQPARLSRYAYLISLFPDELAARLGIRLRLASRPVSSYTPVVRAGRPTGLLVERRPGPATEDSFREITGSVADYDAWRRVLRRAPRVRRGGGADTDRSAAPSVRGAGRGGGRRRRADLGRRCGGTHRRSHRPPVRATTPCAAWSPPTR